MNHRLTVPTTPLAQLIQHGPDQPEWRLVGHGEDRLALAGPPKAR